jgi:hypothetical protein
MVNGLTICESALKVETNTKLAATKNLVKDGESSFFGSCIGLFGELIA